MFCDVVQERACKQRGWLVHRFVAYQYVFQGGWEPSPIAIFFFFLLSQMLAQSPPFGIDYKALESRKLECIEHSAIQRLVVEHAQVE